MSKPSDRQRAFLQQRQRRRDLERPSRSWPVLPVWAAALIVGVLAALAFIGVRAGDFVWDDQILLVEWPYYRDAALFSQALMRHLPFSPNYFRPLVALTFFANYALHGLVASGYRLTNLLLHALTSVLAYMLLRRWLGQEREENTKSEPVTGEPLREWLAFGLALLFAWHPVHVEAVALIVGRFDLLSTLFVLLALVLASLRPPGRWAQVLQAIGSGLAFLLALGCKEMAVTFPLLLLTFDAVRRARWRQRWPVYLALAVAGVVYLALRNVGLGYLYRPQPEAALPAGHALQRLLLVGRSVARYLLLLVWPFGTSAPVHFSPLPVPVTDALAWVELGLTLLLLALLLWALRRGRRAAWLWLAFAISLLPVANILPLELRGGSIVAERFLYLPSFFFILALGGTLWPLLRRATASEPAAARQWWLALTLGAAGVITLIACLVTTLLIVPNWQDDRTLWTWAAARAPRSSLPHTNLSRVALEEGDWARALEEADQARVLNPDDATAHNNAGSALLNSGRAAEAEAAFRQALALQPESTLYWTNLAAAVAEQGRLAEAIAAVEDEVLQRDPSFGPGYALLGALYLNQGQPAKAVAALEQAQRILPDPTIIRSDLAQALLADGQSERALDLLQPGDLSARQWFDLGNELATSEQPQAALRAYGQALQVSTSAGGLSRSELVLLQVQRAAVYQVLGDLEKAEQAALAAMMTDPSEPLVHKAMGDLLHARGSLAAAQKSYERALALAPGFSALYFNLGQVLWEQGKVEEARERFSRYLELAPTGPYAEQARGYLQRQ
ncbi:MAG: tetratricopeptide repeat protein [Anaerolineae bacterium]|nr:tetratricopeptide repeat protein [Anaerolineae bacterium]